MRGLATKPSGSRSRHSNVSFSSNHLTATGRARSARAFESRIGDLRICFANPLILLKPLPLPFVKNSAGIPADLGMEWLKY
jgi:hypothetical protein